jgi:acetolactate synthase-1/2/3 large subunit
VAGYRVEHARQIEEAVARAAREPGPALVEFMIEQEANVFPMIPPGGSLSEPIETVPAGAQAP